MNKEMTSKGGKTGSYIIRVFLVLMIWSVIQTATTLAWRPNGWIYMQWPYAYDGENASWYYLNQTDQQWCLNMNTWEWKQWGQAGSLKTGWQFCLYPYILSWDSRSWYYINEADTLNCLDLNSGLWTYFGQFDANNRATIYAAVGSGSVPNSQLTREIPITVQTSHPDLSIGPAYACGGPDDCFRGVIEVQNQGSKVLSFIRVSGIAIQNAGGATIATDNFTYVQGSLGHTDSDIYTATCLWPGERGYLFEIDTDVPAWDVASMLLTTISAHENEVMMAQASVIPRSASYINTGTLLGGTLTIDFTNYGNTAALLDNTFNQVIYLDQYNQALGWDYLPNPTIQPSTRVLYPGNSGSMSTDLCLFKGSTAKIVPIIDFEDMIGAAKTVMSRDEQPTGLTASEMTEWLNNRRDDAENARRLKAVQ